MTFVKVCNAQDVPPGQMLAVENAALPPVALYNVDGEFFATSNICTHAVAMLTDGYLDGDQIECPMHGGMFSVRTGEPTHFPCVEAIATHAVEIRDGAVFIKAP
jgi:nitrite reductase/ring-hydroxylating ferredoxin subunit